MLMMQVAMTMMQANADRPCAVACVPVLNVPSLTHLSLSVLPVLVLTVLIIVVLLLTGGGGGG